jgi:di/tricarboxylate transporter
VGRSIKDSDFRAHYNAAIWAVHRHGEHIKGKIGQIVVRPGDTLLLEARIGVADALRHSDDFYLTSLVRESRSVRHEKANLAIFILILMVLTITLTSLPPLVVALCAAGLMIATGCVTGAVARKAISWQVLVVIGAALGIGEAMRTSGAAAYLTELMLAALDGAPPSVMIFCLFIMTSVLAQLITNNGAAVLMFPIYMTVAQTTDMSTQGVLFTLMVAAGSSFLSPIAYQTNLMVYGPGSYKFLDFARLGLPLTILLALVCAVLAPLAYSH